MRPSGYKSFLGPRSPVCKKNVSVSVTFPGFQRADSNSCYRGSGGDVETREGRQCSLGPGSPGGSYTTTSRSSSAGTKTPPSRFRPSTDSWSPALLPRHQPIRRQSRALPPSPPILPLNTSPRKPSGSSGFLSASRPFSLLGPACNKPLSAPNSNAAVRRAHELALGNTCTKYAEASCEGRKATPGGAASDTMEMGTDTPTGGTPRCHITETWL